MQTFSSQTEIITYKYYHIPIVTSHQICRITIPAQAHECLRAMEMEIFSLQNENAKLRETKQNTTHHTPAMVRCAVTDQIKESDHRTAELELAVSTDRGGIHCIATHCLWILFSVVGHVWM